MEKVYQPDAEAARLAPACVCNVASRVMWLRKIVEEFDPQVQARLAPFLAPLPFEAELLSCRMDAVDGAIKKIGSLSLDTTTARAYSLMLWQEEGQNGRVGWITIPEVPKYWQSQSVSIVVPLINDRPHWEYDIQIVKRENGISSYKTEKMFLSKGADYIVDLGDNILVDLNKTGRVFPYIGNKDIPEFKGELMELSVDINLMDNLFNNHNLLLCGFNVD